MGFSHRPLEPFLLAAVLLASSTAARGEDADGSTGWTLAFDLKRYDLARSPAPEDLAVEGLVWVRARLHGAEHRLERASGEVTFRVADLAIGGRVAIPGALGAALQVPKVRLGATRGRLLVVHGKATLEPVQVKTPDLEATLSGTIVLREAAERSLVSLDLRFRFTEPFKKAQPLAALLETAAGAQRQADGFLTMRVSGTASRLLFTVRPPSPSRAPVPVEPPPGVPSPGASPSTPTLRGLARQVRPGLYEVKRAALERVLEDVNSLSRAARVVPASRDGVLVGFKIFGIRVASFYSVLGLRNGDVVTAVNGHPMTSPEQALEAYALVRRAKKVVVSLERRGLPMTLTYLLR